MSELAARFGTPLYVYDADQAVARLGEFDRAFAGVDLMVAYSVKANGNLALLAHLAQAGAGADIVSGGELYRALRAGVDPARIVFAGVGKTVDEIRGALAAGIYALNVESEGELHLIDRIAADMGVRAPVGIRVNPDIVSPSPHAYTRTGHAASKFGVPVSEVVRLSRWATRRPALRVRGVDVHIGSQIVDPAPYARAIGTVTALVDQLSGEGIELEYVDLGGGFGVAHEGEEPISLTEVAELVVEPVASRGLRLILEPGRYIVGDAGVLLTEVLFVKRSGGKCFVITDSGMTELLRPSHYGGHHAIVPVRLDEQRPMERVDVVGPICETGDFLAQDREIPLPEPGELLAVGTVGAYGFTMASNYNGRCRPAEVLISGTEALLARGRESHDDLIRGESLPVCSGGAEEPA